jgi:hypothetical protein
VSSIVDYIKNLSPGDHPLGEKSPMGWKNESFGTPGPADMIDRCREKFIINHLGKIYEKVLRCPPDIYLGHFLAMKDFSPGRRQIFTRFGDWVDPPM